ncbi:hypothetical protein N7414_01260 [Pseudomonas sp. GD04087]|uniref:hypothetical protein n=1 Tax=unclassified Pseudomonas TaxID=196821 RepID=UPI002449C645|nr:MULTISPECIES: hypothetical protein [unclassified Pseudomonas]MDH0287727.1 hypothetical protein [Pseudomonas sp. GD04087]MDH1050848.1 hypothetical protein [Pseudomonas sp. GD03903]MDH1999821.1 hypothetical protein [Pseudomonas sp. GD03691]
MTDLTKLKELAERCLEPTKADSLKTHVNIDAFNQMAFRNAAYPKAILDLLERLEKAEKDAERYRELRKITPHRFKKMQEVATTDGGDVFYFHADRFDAALDAALEGGGR